MHKCARTSCKRACARFIANARVYDLCTRIWVPTMPKSLLITLEQKKSHLSDPAYKMISDVTKNYNFCPKSNLFSYFPANSYHCQKNLLIYSELLVITYILVSTISYITIFSSMILSWIFIGVLSLSWIFATPQSRSITPTFQSSQRDT